MFSDQSNFPKLFAEAALIALVLGGIGWVAAQPPGASPGQQSVGWAHYRGNADGQLFSQLGQIDKSNVANLEQVWRVEGPEGGLQTTPLMIGRTIFAVDGLQRLLALDAATGRQLWTFDNSVNGRQPVRGLTWWERGNDRRLFVGLMDRLYALDPATGRPDARFGEGGYVDLRKGLGREYSTTATYMTAPGVIYGDLIITGFRTSESQPAAPGAVRAYDVRTGKLRWAFFTIPRPGEAGHETWPKDAWKAAGGANSWPGMVVDAKLGIVFVPTGSAVDDFYGADRKGNNLFANSLLALDARTGKRLWHFQLVRHDLWDMDFPAPPVLLKVKRNGRTVDAVAQVTKQGYVLAFERRSGRPLFPIKDRAFPRSDVPGEFASPHQPVPLLPAPFARQRLTEAMLTRRTPEAHAYVLERFRKMRSSGIYTPLTVDQDTIMLPGTDGGAEWGGAAVDPNRGILYINSNDVPWMMALAPRDRVIQPGAGLGEKLYGEQCAACHGADRSGDPPNFPALIHISERRRAGEIAALIEKGQGRMPAFPGIRGPDRDALIEFLMVGAAPQAKREVQSKEPAGGRKPPYVFTGYRRFVDPDGYPAAEPPWGTLNAIDMNTGRYLWKIPLGEYPELAAKGFGKTGTENYGGPILTASGLLFIGATIYDRKFRAFDADSGKLLWEADLPYAGNATPITYMVDGVQYVLIATSGGRDWRGPQGTAYVAFALPPHKRRSAGTAKANMP